jgi:hypothetical protein
MTDIGKVREFLRGVPARITPADSQKVSGSETWDQLPEGPLTPAQTGTFDYVFIAPIDTHISACMVLWGCSVPGGLGTHHEECRFV